MHLPVGLLVTSLIFDIIALGSDMRVLAHASFWMMVVGAGFMKSRALNTHLSGGYEDKAGCSNVAPGASAGQILRPGVEMSAMLIRCFALSCYITSMHTCY